jgi:hypothetical protein
MSYSGNIDNDNKENNMTISNPSDRAKFKAMLVEMTKCLQRIDDEKESMKEIAAEAEEKFEIKKKIVSKLARTMYKHNYLDLQEENNHFEFLYESVIEGKIASEEDEEEG